MFFVTFSVLPSWAYFMTSLRSLRARESTAFTIRASQIAPTPSDRLVGTASTGGDVSSTGCQRSIDL